MKRNPGQWSIAFPLLDEDNAPAPFGRQSPRLLISACPLQAESVAALDGFPFVFLLAGKSHFRLKRKEKKKSPNLRCSFIPRLRTHPICPYPTGQNETVGSHDWDECDVADGGLQQLGIYYLDTGNGPFYQNQNHPPTILARYRFSVLSFNVFFFFFFGAPVLFCDLSPRHGRVALERDIRQKPPPFSSCGLPFPLPLLYRPVSRPFVSSRNTTPCASFLGLRPPVLDCSSNSRKNRLPFLPPCPQWRSRRRNPMRPLLRISSGRAHFLVKRVGSGK